MWNVNAFDQWGVELGKVSGRAKQTELGSSGGRGVARCELASRAAVAAALRRSPTARAAHHTHLRRKLAQSEAQAAGVALLLPLPLLPPLPPFRLPHKPSCFPPRRCLRRACVR